MDAPAVAASSNVDNKSMFKSGMSWPESQGLKYLTRYSVTSTVPPAPKTADEALQMIQDYLETFSLYARSSNLATNDFGLVTAHAWLQYYQSQYPLFSFAADLLQLEQFGYHASQDVMCNIYHTVCEKINSGWLKLKLTDPKVASDVSEQLAGISNLISSDLRPSLAIATKLSTLAYMAQHPAMAQLPNGPRAQRLAVQALKSAASHQETQKSLGDIPDVDNELKQVIALLVPSSQSVPKEPAGSGSNSGH